MRLTRRRNESLQGNSLEVELRVHALRQQGYEIDTALEQHATGRLATVRLTRGGASHLPVIDLLFASSGIESEIVLQADPMEVLPGLRIPVATAGHLIALKILSQADTRPQDAIDLSALLRMAVRPDIDVARHAVTLITERGYHRGRDLRAALDDLLDRTQRP